MLVIIARNRMTSMPPRNVFAEAWYIANPNDAKRMVAAMSAVFDEYARSENISNTGQTMLVAAPIRVRARGSSRIKS